MKNGRFQDVSPSGALCPISVDNIPLVSFQDALGPIRHLVPSLDSYAYVTTTWVEELENGPLYGHSVDEASSINLYTREWRPQPEDSLYFKLNAAFRAANRAELNPFLPFLKLLLTALSKLPRFASDTSTLWRGACGDLSSLYVPTKKIWWWGFSSCTTDMPSAISFLGDTNQPRVLWNIHFSSPAFDISFYSAFPNEAEVLLLPGRHLQVVTSGTDAFGLTIIEMKEILPPASVLTGVDFSATNPSQSNTSDSKPLLKPSQYKLPQNTQTAKTTKEILEACCGGKLFAIAPHITSIDLRGNNIGDNGTQHLSEALKSNNTLANINLNNNNIGENGAQHLSELLKSNNTLTTIDLSNNNIESHGARYLGEALKSNNTLTTINLSGLLLGNNIGENGARYLSEALKSNSTLTTINLNNNNIGDTGARYLGEALKSNSTLMTIILGSNKIGVNGAQHLSEALKSNSTLTAINLNNNNIGDNGALCLSETLKSNKTLITVDLYTNNIGSDGARYLSEVLKSNNTLTTIDIGGNIFGENGAQYFREASKWNNTRRIHV